MTIDYFHTLLKMNLGAFLKLFKCHFPPTSISSSWVVDLFHPYQPSGIGWRWHLHSFPPGGARMPCSQISLYPHPLQHHTPGAVSPRSLTTRLSPGLLPPSGVGGWRQDGAFFSPEAGLGPGQSQCRRGLAVGPYSLRCEPLVPEGGLPVRTCGRAPAGAGGPPAGPHRPPCV